MALSQFTLRNQQYFVGLSTDSKPSVPAGSPGGPQSGDVFLESDTGQTYYYNANAAAWASFTGSGFSPASDVTAGTLTAAGSGTTNFALINPGRKTLNLGINITAITAGSLTVTIQGKDVASGQFYTILASAALASVAFTRIKVGPTVAQAANTIAQDYLPRTLQIAAVVATGPVTATIGASFV